MKIIEYYIIGNNNKKIEKFRETWLYCCNFQNYLKIKMNENHDQAVNLDPVWKKKVFLPYPPPSTLDQHMPTVTLPLSQCSFYTSDFF